MKPLFALPIIVSFAFGGSTPRTAGEGGKDIIKSFQSRGSAYAINELQSLKAANEKDFAANDYDYLLGRVAEENGQLASAMSSYQTVANRDSALRAYALKRMSQIARSTGNLLLERIYLTKIAVFLPNSLIARSAMLRIAQSSFESGDYPNTIRILTSENLADPSSNKSTKLSNIRQTQALLATALIHDGKHEIARGAFTKLIDTVPTETQPDDFSLSAAKGLDLLDVGNENLGKRISNLPEIEHLRRANIYQFNREFADAKLHFDAVIANYPNSSNTADAAFQIGRGYAQQANYVEALKWFERVIEQYPESSVAKDAVLQSAAAYSRVVRPKEAISRYQSFIDKYPTDERLDRAYLNIVDILRDKGEDTEALKWCGNIQKLFAGKLPEAIAMFTEVRIHLAREEWQLALDLLERLRSFPQLGGSAVPGGTSVTEILFLKGFALEQIKRYPEAIEIYLSIADGREEYYGGRATERLKLLNSDENARSYIGQTVGTLFASLTSKDADAKRRTAQAILRITENSDLREKSLAVLKTAVYSLPRYKEIPIFKFGPAPEEQHSAVRPNPTAAARLLSLGLYDEAVPELEAETPSLSNISSDRLFAIASYSERGDRADRGIAILEPLWRKIPADYPLELIPREQLEMLYPAPYTKHLLASTAGRGIDPRLVLAVMRQESRFQANAKSFAAARGLMQFIATTSVRVASEVGRDNFRQDDLYHPPTAILMGSQYVADLFKLFPNQPDAVTASYNGGDDNMKRWLARARSNMPERYVPEIVYAQSKDYVQKVMASYRVYKFLYDENLSPN